MSIAEDQIRLAAEEALAWLPGLEVRRMFGGWGFYCDGLLFAAAWKGAFRFRWRRENHWMYDAVDPALIEDEPAFREAVLTVLEGLRREPAAGAGRRRR